MAKDKEPERSPDIPPPELTSETWIQAQDNIILFGTALRKIAANTDDPEIWKIAINAIIKSGMQHLFLGEEL